MATEATTIFSTFGPDQNYGSLCVGLCVCLSVSLQLDSKEVNSIQEAKTWIQIINSLGSGCSTAVEHTPHNRIPPCAGLILLLSSYFPSSVECP